MKTLLIRLSALMALVLAFAMPAMVTAAPAPVPADAEDDDDGWDDDDDADLDSLLDMPIGDEGWEEEAKPRTYPWFEHHGYFRFRSDMFWRAHLGTDYMQDGATSLTSGVLPPVSHNYVNNQSDSGVFDADDVGLGRDDNTLWGANIRFRYTPTIHLTSDLRITAQFDVLDNLVLGSTPDYSGSSLTLRPDAPLVVLGSGGQAPDFEFRDAIQVKQVFGEWRSLIGLLRFGRMAEHWGMGVLQHGGQEPDSDYGDFVDRVSWTGRFWGIDLMLAYDFASSGATSQSAGQFFGQPYDLDEADDVHQVVVALFQRPQTEEDIALRRRDLDEKRKPVLDWGLYNLFRWQDLDLTQASYAGSTTDPDALDAYVPAADSWDSLQYIQRDAFVWIPDLWLRFEWRPAYGRKLHLELEAVFVYGRFNAAVAYDGEDTDLHETDILQYGGVLQADYTMGGLSFGLEAGVASGDESEGFGVLDMSNLYKTDSDGNVVPNGNKRLTSFVFDRDFHTDLMLFREVIGAVTNSLYFKPFVQYDLFEGEEDALGARLDLLYARALEASATPGNDANLGVEMDVRLFYEEAGRFLAMIEWGMFFPLGAFDRIDGWDGYSMTKSAKWATTVQFRLHWMF